MTDPFVVVGGDAAGLSAASKARREAPDREVVVFERGQWVSYAHCGEPYFVKGEVEKLEDLLSLSPEEVEDRGIDLRREHEVVGVNVDAETVGVQGPNGQFEQPYSDLLVATGARAVTEPIEGHDLDAALPMHGLDCAAALRALLLDPDADHLAAVGGESYVDRELVERYGAMQAPETVAIVGGGYVGVEMAEAFGAHDLDVHLFQRPEHVLESFGEPVAERVEATLREHGVALHLGEEVARLEGNADGRVSSLTCSDGTTLSCELALVGIGVRPNTALLADTPIELGASGAVAVDEYGQTNVDGVYAAGDCAEAIHAVSGEPEWVPLGLTANRAGRAVGTTVARTTYDDATDRDGHGGDGGDGGGRSLAPADREPIGDVAGTAVTKAFDMECGRAGITDHAEAREYGFDPVTETVTTRSRSGYYPGAAETVVSLTADRDSERLLGGTIAGTDRAAIRIDTVATALEAEMTVGDLERTDLAYAPPFSPVWDPILTAAKVLRGTLSD
ncbi:FAD-dependent oxidoreductase [Halorubellus sp. JP-L1]|uniref:FAD-dependent oxidoreductase n=1 Tax=Halorubellus sp. JP-L1 TaxID=2715753 RepID=UPI00140CD753|nr:FAD-dependent oxidoreductase [Halorubellus sp. JP-L1]NHN41690.1 FAD-dependent oxidoreductase [Halorubellus sp. JP-L1]